jgi:alpha-ribazole phosphatase
MLLTLLRHGEVEGRAQVLRGRSDPMLSAHGFGQLQRVFDTLDTQPTALACSPLRRCAAFAELQSSLLQLPLHSIDQLREIDFGDWEELTLNEAEANTPENFARFKNDTANWCPPNGEAYAEFRQRVRSAVQTLCSLRASHLLVITHGGVIRALLAELLDLSPASAGRFGVPLAGIAQLWIDDKGLHSDPVRGSLLRLHWLESPCS